MHSLEPEFRELRAAGIIDDAVAVRAIALEGGTVFSLFEELRVALYGSVALITTGLGILLKNNLNRIGPVAVVVGLALVAAVCYATAIRARRRVEPRTTAGDYILLLGALIVSADLGYAEATFHWLGPNWSWHLLVLAVVHAITAYALDSRLVLSVALTSLAAWFGIESRMMSVVANPERIAHESGLRALLCAVTIFAWREGNRRLRAAPQFQEVFEHFCVNLAFWAALAWCIDAPLRPLGMVLLVILSTLAIRRGLRSAAEVFVVYGVVYAAVGTCWVLGQSIPSALGAAVLELVTVIGATVALWHLHPRLKGRTA